MSKAALSVRILLGLLFFVSAIFAFASMFGLTPPPEIPEGPMKTYMMGLMATKYFFPFLKATELIVGLLLIVGFYVPLALIVLAPISLNIFLTHLFIAPETILVAVLIIAAHVFLGWYHRKSYSALFIKK